MDNKIDEFTRKYDAVVKPSHQRWHRAKPVPYHIFEERGFDAFEAPEVETIPMVDITLPEDRFRALLEHDKWVTKAGLHDNRHFNNNVGRVANLVVEHERECRIRQQHPAVQKAWEQYQIMLRMVDCGEY